MIIEKGAIDQLEDCRQCLANCVLGERYFYDINHTVSFITEGVNKGEIYIAKDSLGEVTGFMRIDLLGTFAKFPLLRVIAVKENYRGQGLGSIMMRFYEGLGFENSDKAFLLVSEFNLQAKSLYERIGYDEVGKIPDLYHEGAAEFLMMKKRFI